MHHPNSCECTVMGTSARGLAVVGLLAVDHKGIHSSMDFAWGLANLGS